MPNSLESLARQSLFVIKEGTRLKKIKLQPEWPSAVVENSTQLLSCVQKGVTSNQFTLLLLSEEDFSEGLQAVKQGIGKETLSRFGIVVVCKDADSFFESHHGTTELLEIIPEKDFKKYLDFHLLRALRHLLRGEGRDYKKVSKKTLAKLNEIFIALSVEREPTRLLSTILFKAMELTGAEGGSLLMIQESDGEMYFRLKITDEMAADSQVQTVNIKVVESSLCGFVALTGKSINVADTSELKPLSFPQVNRSVDYYHDSKTQSLLTVPLKNSRNEIIAVLQLANKRNEMELVVGPHTLENRFTSFEAEDESLLSSFATQAAICLENVDLYADIRRLFEGFVRASITAIESRDPSTGGHSERVAKMTVALARATTECEVGIYRSVRFKEEEIRELEYAAMLHDFGKIGVREEVLVKAKKLHPYQLEGIRDRIKICKAAARVVFLEKRAKSSSGDITDKEFQRKISEIEEYWKIIQQANEPSVLKQESAEALEKLRSENIILPDGSQIALLSEDEYKALSVTKGSLTEHERLEIESHVRHTYQFLKMIPWTKDFKHLPDIAYAHHEKLDGTGYPRGLTSHEIPLQSKMMTISDIFDALTAADRWYKEAVPVEKALDILAQEVAEGKLDPVLFDLFVQKKIYEIVRGKRFRQVG